MSEVVTKVITWDDYVRGEPAELEHYEIEDGVVIELPAPTLHHQRIVRRLLRFFEDFLSKHNLGEVLAAPFDVVVQRSPVRTRQPDLLVVLREKVHQMEASPERLEFAPDLVIEVLSPSESITTLLKKLDDYHRIGVKEVWIVNPAARNIEILKWREDDWESVGIFGEGDTIKSKELLELSLPVEQIFETA